MRPLSRSEHIWMAIGASVFVGVPVYNVFVADDGDTLSEAFDRILERYPWLKPVVLTLARHLANDIEPPWADPIGFGFVVARRLVPRRRTVVVVVDD